MSNCHQFISNSYEQRIAKHFFPWACILSVLCLCRVCEPIFVSVCVCIRHINRVPATFQLISCWGHTGEAQARLFAMAFPFLPGMLVHTKISSISCCSQDVLSFTQKTAGGNPAFQMTADQDCSSSFERNWNLVVHFAQSLPDFRYLWYQIWEKVKLQEHFLFIFNEHLNSDFRVSILGEQL